MEENRPVYTAAVVEGLNQRPKKRAARNTSLANMKLEDGRPDPQRFTHVVSLPVDKLDWALSQQKLAVLLQSSMYRCMLS